ncbi:HlyD family efflux transporter periplasmic adaptor subunit [Acidipila sp. EB88]|uniref:HlyD family efflux transporter periplasmic adaptor subunit n=1 Tax=Acidipila sp. EB88 TaxID=2305226 RepID=UPI000F6026EE|nr:HlyD family efflux transporter periplasmic adaptor subunit [Acidipila sp. EB88]RRA47316.1 biotin/lipoyl-binding protein [Acidipila sp. EB88]
MAEDNAPHGNADATDTTDRNESQKRAPGQPDARDPAKQNEPPDPSQPDKGTRRPTPEQRGRQTVSGRIISGIIIAATILVVAIVISETGHYPRTDDAEVFANYIGMAPIVNGPITAVNVHDNQQVHAGEVLFQVDPRPYRYALERAKSDQLALEGQITDEARRIHAQENAAVAAQAAARTSEANVGRATSGVDEAAADVGNAQAGLDRARAEYTYSLNNLHRVEPLLARQFVTVDQVDQLRTGTAAKELAVKQAESQLSLTQARLQSSYAALTASKSTVSQSQAQGRQQQSAITTLSPFTAQRGSRASAVENAQYNYDNCTIRAPFDARVTNLTLSEGAFAHAGEQVFTLIDTRVWWVVANFRETQLHRILPGMHVDVYLMSNPNRLYRGIVDSASFGVTPDASTVGRIAQGLPDVQRTLSWVHLASRYPVRIRVIDPEPNAFRISESAVVVVRGWDPW